jgi:PAS domain S-box-containing protein
MAISKRQGFILFSGLGFVAAIAIGLLLFAQFRSTLVQYTGFAEKIHQEHIEYIYSTNLANITLYIEQQYSVLKEDGWLRQRVGTDSFWEIADEWHKIAMAFNLEYINYIEKSNSGYILLLSSGILQDEHREFSGRPVWVDSPPVFINEALKTKQLTIFMEPANNEHGTLVSAVQPILSGEAVLGFLIVSIDNNVTYMDHLVRQEIHLREQENILLYRIGIVLLIAVFIILLLAAYHIWLTRRSFMVPVREVEAEKRTRLMLDTAPLICVFLNENGKPIDCNQETLRTFGLEKKQDYLEHFFDFCPEYQPGGESSRNIIEQLTERARKSGYHRIKWMHITRTGEEFPVELTVMRIPWKGSYCFASYARKLRLL